MDEQKPILPKINPMKRRDKIVVLLLVIYVLSWLMAASFGFAIGVGGLNQYRPIMEFLFWTLILTMIPLGLIILKATLDRFRDIMNHQEKARRLIRMETHGSDVEEGAEIE